MKSGWVFILFFLGMIAELLLLRHFDVANHMHNAIWGFAVWIHSNPLLELCFWAVMLAIGLTGFLYSLYKMFKSLEW